MKPECAVNQFQVAYLERVVRDLPEDAFWTPGAGHGHTPVWLVGHLAIVGELGRKLLGQDIEHPRWLPAFGPGSADPPALDQAEVDPAALRASLTATYDALRTDYHNASAEHLASPHGVAILDGSAIRTIHDALVHILTSHFAFHLAQLSAIRRGHGHGPLL